MYVKPTGPQGIGSVLDGSFRLMVSHYRGIWSLALAGGLAANANVLILAGLGPGAPRYVTPGTLGIYVPLTITGLLVAMPIYGAILIRFARLAARDPVGGELGIAFRRLGALILLVICSTLVVAGVSVPLGAYLMNVWGSVGPSELVGAALLSAPVWWFAVSLCLSQVFLFVERLGPVGSLRASHGLVWGNWWRTAIALTIGGVFVLITSVITSVGGATVRPFLYSGDAVIAAISLWLLSAALSMFVGPYLVSLQLAIYFDLKQRREGVDLLARAEAMS